MTPIDIKRRGKLMEEAANKMCVQSVRFAFDETKFVTQAGAHGDFTADERADIGALRARYPELETWGDQAIFHAWQDYSQNAHLTGWREDLPESDREEFLDYLCWNQTQGTFPWGGDRNQLKKVRGMWCHQLR